MDYNCNLLNINKILYDKKGIVAPLCNSCKTGDCTNPIEFVNCSILGCSQKCRVYSRGQNYYFVTQCVGYSSIDESLEEVEDDQNIIEDIEDMDENNVDKLD